MAIWQRVGELVERTREEGAAWLLSRLREEARNRLRPGWRWLCCVSTADVAPPVLDDGLSFKAVRELGQLSAEEKAAVDQSLGASALPIVERRLTHGAELHLLFSGSRVAGSGFLVDGSRHPFQHAALTERDSMLLDFRVDPAFRGSGLHAKMLLASIDHMRRRGFERVYASCSERNEPVLRAYARIGIRKLVRFKDHRGRYRFEPPHLD